MKGYTKIVFACMLLVGVSQLAAVSDEDENAVSFKWLDRFSFQPPLVSNRGVCQGRIGDLPSFEVAAKVPGKHLVRISLPFAPGALPVSLGVKVCLEDTEIVPDLRLLTQHPGRPECIRSAILTFPFEFKQTGIYHFALSLTDKRFPISESVETTETGLKAILAGTQVVIETDSVQIQYKDGTKWKADLIAPAHCPVRKIRTEIIEHGEHYLWVRLLEADNKWPRITEVRIDSQGTVAVQTHLQRLEPGNDFMPRFGWEISGPKMLRAYHSFAEGVPFTALTEDKAYEVYFPIAPFKLRGVVEANANKLKYFRCDNDEKVPFQLTAWRKAEFVIGKAGHNHLNEILSPNLEYSIAPMYYDSIYNSGENVDLSLWPVIFGVSERTWEILKKSALRGDDYGNITRYSKGKAIICGFNRLNHCPAIFEEAYRSSDLNLLKAAILWCSNMYDLSIWWGNGDDFGGTRYNNKAALSGDKPDPNFMWRSNQAIGFCTKGYDSFFYAYEQTGDPRMTTALHHQVQYAKKHVHADRGQCRNIGDVQDFMRLYRFTGVDMYRYEAMRLFGQLKTKLSDGNLFSQTGVPIKKDLPFIDRDGITYAFAKPYIVGYALQGLPELLRDCPDEPNLYDVVWSVSDFLSQSQDPTGGWRYPHPQSSRVVLGLSLENSMQLTRAAKVLEERGYPIGKLLDAVERTLQLFINTYAKTGTFISQLSGWEISTGFRKNDDLLQDIYSKPQDRTPSRDYTEGKISMNAISVEGLIYFSEVLNFYLKHRPAERLLHTNEELSQVLARCNESKQINFQKNINPEFESCQVSDLWPKFYQKHKSQMKFPLSFHEANMPFRKWRKEARKAYINHLSEAPLRIDFSPETIGIEDRGSYESRKILFNINSDSRIEAYLLIPKGKGPFPAIIALHDHGAHFKIGKEKVVHPFNEPNEIIDDAQQWVNKFYGGHFIGDELAKRGYAVFSMDVIPWGQRGNNSSKFDKDMLSRSTFSINMNQLGFTWAGYNIWDDIRSAEFVQSLPEVDPEKIGCIGLSMGANRAWHLAAATDIVKAGAAICWLGDTQSIASPAIKYTVGYSMMHPGLCNLLDYPDVASIACPKPMLFYNGKKDSLFPVEGVKQAYARMQNVWAWQGVKDHLVCKLWDVPHMFNIEMQQEAFDWLDKYLKSDNICNMKKGETE